MEIRLPRDGEMPPVATVAGTSRGSKITCRSVLLIASCLVPGRGRRVVEAADAAWRKTVGCGGIPDDDLTQNSVTSSLAAKRHVIPQRQAAWLADRRSRLKAAAIGLGDRASAPRPLPTTSPEVGTSPLGRKTTGM